MNRDIDMEVQGCGVCQRYRPAQQKEKMVEVDKKSGEPWDTVGMDLFVWEGKTYLVVVDCYSNYPEIALLGSTSSEAVIVHIKSIFSRHGIPRRVISDNGPQFDSQSFRRFADDYQFQHVTSSPKYPQANGQAEKAVGIVKCLLNRARRSGGDPYLVMPAYRRAPREHGESPTQMLMGRRLRCQLPELAGLRESGREGYRRREEMRNKQVTRYNETAKDLKELKEEDVVRIRDKNWDTKAVVLKEVAPHSNEVKTEDGGIYRRNRSQLLRGNEPYVQQHRYVDIEESEGQETVGSGVRNGVTGSGASSVEADEEKDDQEETHYVVRRSTRTRRPVDRLDL
jgi:hypothetical protein